MLNRGLTPFRGCTTCSATGLVEVTADQWDICTACGGYQYVPGEPICMMPGCDKPRLVEQWRCADHGLDMN